MGPQLPWLSRSHLGSPYLTDCPGSASEAGVWVAVTKVVSAHGRFHSGMRARRVIARQDALPAG